MIEQVLDQEPVVAVESLDAVFAADQRAATGRTMVGSSRPLRSGAVMRQARCR
nr:hypothetical protein [Pseudomonas sp. BIGb0427]